MTNSEVIPAELLQRKAVVYVRQSSPAQVVTNLESQRLQYDLVRIARQRGFVDIEVIDDDLGCSANGTVSRPRFDRLLGLLRAGKIGAVLCFDASRLARNGRDWQHLLELCGMVKARVIDADGVYDPGRPNEALVHMAGPGVIGWPPHSGSDYPDAAQTQRRPPSPHPEDVVQACRTGRPTKRACADGGSLTLWIEDAVQRWNAGRPLGRAGKARYTDAAIQDQPDAAHGVQAGLTPDRGPDDVGADVDGPDDLCAGP